MSASRTMDSARKKKAAEKAPEPERAPRYMGHSTSTELLLPAHAGAVPAPVAAANAAAVSAYDEYRSARARQFELAQAARHAPAVERSADRGAVAAGESLSAHGAASQARAAHESALREQQATKLAFFDAQTQLARAIASEHDEWLPAQEQQIGVAIDRAHAAIDELASSFDALAAEQHLLGQLRKFPTTGGSLVGVQFNRKDTSASAQERREQARTDVREHAQVAGRNAWVPRELDALLGALSLLVEDAAVSPDAR